MRSRMVTSPRIGGQPVVDGAGLLNSIKLALSRTQALAHRSPRERGENSRGLYYAFRVFDKLACNDLSGRPPRHALHVRSASLCCGPNRRLAGSLPARAALVSRSATLPSHAKPRIKNGRLQLFSRSAFCARPLEQGLCSFDILGTVTRFRIGSSVGLVADHLRGPL